MDFNLLYRWFVGLGMDDKVWNHAVFSKNRHRLLNSEVAQAFFAAVLDRSQRLMSNDHFTVNGTLIQAWASQKTIRHAGYRISLSCRWLVEKGFGWLKETGPIRQVKVRGMHKVDWVFVFSCAVHNLIRLPKLIAMQHLSPQPA